MSYWGGGAYGGYGAPPPPAYNYNTQSYGGYQQQDPMVSGRQKMPRRSSSAQPQPDRNTLWSYFQRVDRNQNGQIDSKELQDALSNGTWIPFNPETVRIMITMFDTEGKGTINFHEFCSLWKYVSEWQATFQRFDTDRSGNIDRGELRKSLTSFGYKLSDRFYDLLMARFDRSRTRRLNFDDFIQLCVVLQTLTASFREKDKNRRGVIRISYEEFLTMVTDVICRMFMQ